MSVLELKNVSFSYDKKTPVLKGVSLSVEKGEYVVIMGRNGSGKSTLSKLFNALLKPDEGEVSVFGFSSADKDSLFEIRRRTGVVFQNPDNQLVATIVEDDVAFGPENVGLPREEIGKRIDFALKSVGMENYRKSATDRLSGGQKQRVAIAGVLALRPEIIVLDESTSMLDPSGRKEILDVVKKLNENGVTVIAVTHYMEEAVGADKIFVLDGGKIVCEGSPKEVFSQKEMLKSCGLGLPTPAEMAEELKNRGVPIKGLVLTEEDLGEALCE